MATTCRPAPSLLPFGRNCARKSHEAAAPVQQSSCQLPILPLSLPWTASIHSSMHNGRSKIMESQTRQNPLEIGTSTAIFRHLGRPLGPAASGKASDQKCPGPARRGLVPLMRPRQPRGQTLAKLLLASCQTAKPNVQRTRTCWFQSQPNVCFILSVLSRAFLAVSPTHHPSSKSATCFSHRQSLRRQPERLGECR